MMEKLKQGFYAKPGGYDLFCKDLEDIEKKYNSQANKVKAEEVLDEFLKQKSVDSKVILQADKKLTKKEKKIKKGFNEKADRMRQEIEEFKKRSIEAENNRAKEFALILENANRRHEETMAQIMQNHREQMMEIQKKNYLFE
ncbi:guanylate-binding 1-like protein [Labeo rohita]|uniref:Guanylate-binding 1-like protein n=1 Tax=Labeo rohita TaxID=84645 RepID=A0A498LC23_LABRO|nr:guanylate-binding 1-like protein [Labeo rohita]